MDISPMLTQKDGVISSVPETVLLCAKTVLLEALEDGVDDHSFNFFRAKAFHEPLSFSILFDIATPDTAANRDARINCS